jgi:hypothetical protein
MKSILRVTTLSLALLLAAPNVLQAQDKKIAAGTYELVPDANFSGGGFDVAAVLVEFTETHMTAFMQGQLLVKSKITIVGDEMIVEDLEGQVACPGIAKFRLSFTEKGFRMTPVEDPCAERGAILAQVTMVKKG